MKQQSLKRCPIGIQAFEKVIEGNYLYIDKTEYIYRMANGASKYCFLSRPPAFRQVIAYLYAALLFCREERPFQRACHRKAGNRVDGIPGAAL